MQNNCRSNREKVKYFFFQIYMHVFHTGNSWGRDPQTGEGCLGCGAQEQFYGCADVNIRPKNPSAQRREEEKPPQESTKSPQSATDGRYRPDVGAGNVGNTEETVVTRKCLAVNNWEGDPELDSWCDANCNKMIPRFCPPIFCACQLM